MKSMIEQEKSEIHRAATILDENSQISTDRFEKDIFVVYSGQVAVGGSRISHENAALQNKLFYPETLSDRKLQIDDGGMIFDDGEKLIIPFYFTSGTTPKSLHEAIMNDEGQDLREVIDSTRRNIRKNTGRLIANITNREVEVQHDDETSDIFSPLR